MPHIELLQTRTCGLHMYLRDGVCIAGGLAKALGVNVPDLQSYIDNGITASDLVRAAELMGRNVSELLIERIGKDRHRADV